MQTDSLGETNISGNRVELRPVKHDDFELLSRWLSDPEVYRWWGGEPIASDVIRQKYLGLRRPQIAGYIIEVAGIPIGYAQRHRTSDNEGSIDLFLVPGMRNRGYGSNAVGALVEHLAQVEGWKQITVDPEQDNIPAQSFWKKMGFSETEKTTADGNLLFILRLPTSKS